VALKINVDSFFAAFFPHPFRQTNSGILHYLIILRDQTTVMRKITLLLALAILASTALLAQSSTRKFSWGLKSGVNVSRIATNDASYEDLGNRAGFIGGAFFIFREHKKIAIQPEVFYSSLGATYNRLGRQNVLRLNYVSFPILARYQLNRRFVALAGPQFDVIAMATRIQQTEPLNDNVSENYRENNFSAAVGIEYWPLRRIAIAARYVHGLNNISMNNANPVRNRTLQFTTSLRF
jgi:hypothetical protein